MADDFSEKLNAVLSNPDAMGQIMSIARSLTGEGDDSSPAPSQEAVSPDRGGRLPAVAAEPAMPDLSGLLGLLGNLTGGGGTVQPSAAPGNPLSALTNLDPRLLQTGLRLFSEYNRVDDRTVALLSALKPFLKEERAAKIDRAARAAKLARLARVALQMFKEGDADV